jgi:hypothetical protein
LSATARPSVRMAIGGESYNLSLDLGALATAEYHFRALGYRCNLITSIPIVTERAYAAVEVFACALRGNHPKISFERAVQLYLEGGCELIATTLDRSWPVMSVETAEANRNLRFDLDELTKAAEQFALMGRGVRVATLTDGLSLAAVRSIYPCALRQYRPDLTFTAARELMSLQSVYAVAKGFSDAWRAASPATKERFSISIVGQRTWTGIAHA